MELDQLRNCYRLKPITADPRKFLLDPHNPRIALLLDDPSLLNNGTNVASDTVQKAVFNVLKRPEFSLDQLIARIRQMGFINNGENMIVQSKGDRFLVLEGNRRTAAIRSLLATPELVSPSVRESLRSVEVQEFSYTGGRNTFSERDVIETILGQIHISGKLSWGAMERADYIYQSFCRIAGSLPSELYTFGYSVPAAQRVAETFSCSVKDVRKNIMIARNYLLLRKLRAKVDPDHYTLIELATTKRSVKDALFELSEDYFHFSDKGAELFAELCIEQDALIHNPDDFNVLAKVADTGDSDFLYSLLSRNISIQDAQDKLSRISTREQFERQLARAYDILSELPIEAFRGNQKEKALIAKLAEIVNTHLKPLMRE